jgi:hypothetical protein
MIADSDKTTFMEDFKLKVFHSVAKNKSFTRAAAELFITQPAVTKQVKNLEESLDTRLFERTGNCITMTPEGEVYSGIPMRSFICIRDFYSS